MAIHGEKAMAMDDHGLVGCHILHRGWTGNSHEHNWTLTLRFRLHTLLIVLALGPPVLAWVVPPIVEWVREPPTPKAEYGSSWNRPYEYIEWDTKSLDGPRR